MIPIPRLYPEATIAVIATGPSLTRGDCDTLREKVTATIAVNCAYQYAPWCEILYGTDSGQFWTWYWHDVHDLPALKYTLRPENPDQNPHRIPALGNAGDEGLSLDPTMLATGQNSGYAAINLAVLLGARRIALLGFDCQRGPNGERHCHPDHPTISRGEREPNYLLALNCFETIAAPLAQIGVAVVNLSRQTAIKVFPRMALEAFT